MIQGKNVIGIIPARGNSKGLPGKNILKLCGKPLIAWTIEAALHSKYLDEVMVTTDSSEIAAVAKKFGAQVPFLRPAELATDTSPSCDAIVHTLEFYQRERDRRFDYLCILEPTSPLREVQDIDKPLEILLQKQAGAIVGICKTEEINPAFLVEMDETKILKYLSDEKTRTQRRQEIHDVYFFEGTIYISQTDLMDL